jgi:aspartate dehydrogenase
LLHNARIMCTNRTTLASGEDAVKQAASGCAVGLIGGGAVAASIASELVADRAGLRLVAALVRSDAPALPGAVARVETVDELLAAEPDVVVEAASRTAVRELGPAVVAAGVDLLVVSTGALLEDALAARLHALGCRSGARVVLATGAVAGIDALRAARVGGLDRVEVEQRKPARVLLGAEEAAGLDGPVCVFDGTVREAARAYPATTNILATIALAGLGPERTRVRLIADPAATANHARLRASGSFGSLDVVVENRPSANPRSSVLTGLSVVGTLRERFLGGGLAWPGWPC